MSPLSRKELVYCARSFGVSAGLFTLLICTGCQTGDPLLRGAFQHVHPAVRWVYQTDESLGWEKVAETNGLVLGFIAQNLVKDLTYGDGCLQFHEYHPGDVGKFQRTVTLRAEDGRRRWAQSASEQGLRAIHIASLPVEAEPRTWRIGAFEFRALDDAELTVRSILTDHPATSLIAQGPGCRLGSPGRFISAPPLIFLIWNTRIVCIDTRLIAEATDLPIVTLRPVERFVLPGVYKPNRPAGGTVDCNSPAHWDDAVLYVFSSEDEPWRTSGPDLMHLKRQSQASRYDCKVNGGRWIEATHKQPGGELYGWYHREPHPVCPDKPNLTVPLIGQAVSNDNGLHWRDLGIVLKAPQDSSNCGTANRYFAGGNGDFCVIPDQKNRYFYFFISTYNRDPAEQGVAVARTTALGPPIGAVVRHLRKWYRGGWTEPGRGGHVTPIFPPAVDWHQPDASAFWGPSVHYNTHLLQYVMLLNRSKDKDWAQEGIYISFNHDLADPGGWSKPVKILDANELEGSKWYPQVIGTNAAERETDKLAGRTARLFVAGVSKWEIEFRRPGAGS